MSACARPADCRPVDPPGATRVVDPHLAKIEEWVERSHGRVRAEVVHDKLRALGLGGSERTTRRAVAQANEGIRGRPSAGLPTLDPGIWLQFDWGKGPRIDGRETLLWCAWLAWSRFRVVIPTWDRTMPTVIACLDETLRRFGGSPTYALTDNERTVTIDRVAGIAVKHPVLVAAGRHYGLQIHACVPADPASKDGSESTVKIAKADLVPTAANLLPAYETFAGLRAACAAAGVAHRGGATNDLAVADVDLAAVSLVGSLHLVALMQIVTIGKLGAGGVQRTLVPQLMRELLPR